MKKTVALISDTPEEVRAAIQDIHNDQEELKKFVNIQKQELKRKLVETKNNSEARWKIIDNWLAKNGKLPEDQLSDPRTGFNLDENTLYYTEGSEESLITGFLNKMFKDRD